MENIYSKSGLQAVINASGRMTKLGVSTISKGVGGNTGGGSRQLCGN
ncbi:hypothetical protein [Lacrimispora xylanisolvens]